jgi:dienelactone hydrolase
MGCSALPGSSFDVTPPKEKELPLMDRLAPVDGTIIHALETGITKGWSDLSPTGRARFSEDQWNAAIESVERHAELLTYSSDGLRIGALLVRPASTEGRQLGAVIVNRDGLAGRGLDKDLILGDLAFYANEGFVAVSSAYRGNQLSQGVDELGGDDVNDVLSLVTLVQRLDYVDPDRIFMVGFGRGGMMTYRALEMDAPIRAAAVISGASDMAEVEAINPEISRGFSDSGGWDGLAKIYGGWDAEEKTRELERRSPRGRAGNGETPLLIVHGRLDERVPVGQAMDVASRWNKSEIPVESVIYGYGNHSLVEQQADWRGRVMNWIKRHDARSLLN